MTGLFENGHELKDCEGPADLQVLEPAIKAAEDRGVVAADIEDFVALQVQVAVEGLGEHLIGSCQGVEGPWSEERLKGGERSPYRG